jgi:hypothetical protein
LRRGTKAFNRQTEELAHGLVLFGTRALITSEPGLALGDIFQNQRPTGKIAQKILFRLPGLDRRTELLDGEIIDMETVSPLHANIGDILSRISMKVPAADSGCVSSFRSI